MFHFTVTCSCSAIVLRALTVHKQNGGCDAAKPSATMLTASTEVVKTSALVPCLAGQTLYDSLQAGRSAHVLALPHVEPQHLQAMRRLPLADISSSCSDAGTSAVAIVKHLASDACVPSSGSFGCCEFVRRPHVHQHYPGALYAVICCGMAPRVSLTAILLCMAMPM